MWVVEDVDYVLAPSYTHTPGSREPKVFSFKPNTGTVSYKDFIRSKSKETYFNIIQELNVLDPINNMYNRVTNATAGSFCFFKDYKQNSEIRIPENATEEDKICIIMTSIIIERSWSSRM